MASLYQKPADRSMTAVTPRHPRNTKGRSGGGTSEIRRAAQAALASRETSESSALASLETRVGLADHEDLAATAHDLAVAMPLLCGLEGRKHFHGMPRGVKRRENGKRGIIKGFSRHANVGGSGLEEGGDVRFARQPRSSLGTSSRRTASCWPVSTIRSMPCCRPAAH